jgi:hypothetical protein
MERMDNKGIVKCPMCDWKFYAKDYIKDYDKGIVECPFCDELIKITNMKPTKPKGPEIYYLVTFAHFVNGDSLEHATWVTRDEAFGGLVWRNYVGGMCPCSDEDKVHEMTMADDIFDLDWTKTYMCANLKEDFYHGWLSPNGEFVQSSRDMMFNTAEYIIGKSPDELKKDGWLKLELLGKEPYYTPRNLVTKKQYDWLKSKGYETVDMEDVE